MAVFYTNESDRVGDGDGGRDGGRGCGRGAGTGWRTVGGPAGGYEAEAPTRGSTTTAGGGGYEHNFGFLILDLCSGLVCQVTVAYFTLCYKTISVTSNLSSMHATGINSLMIGGLQRSSQEKWRVYFFTNEKLSSEFTCEFTKLSNMCCSGNQNV